MAQEGDVEPPCDLRADRVVEPLVVYAGDEVTVRTRISAKCDPSQRPGVDIMYVVDRSITVHQDGLLDSIKDGLTAFTVAMDFERSSAGLITFAARSQVATNLTKDQQRVLNAIQTIRLSEESDTKGLAAAFRTAVGKLDNDGDEGNEKIVLIAIAGPDAANALVNMPTVTNAARNAGIKVIFLLFPFARYRHYIEAASDCDMDCPRYQLGANVVEKWAWSVDESNFVERVEYLADRLMRARMLDRVVLEEYLHSGAVLAPGSVAPPANQIGQRLQWTLNAVPEEGITLSYRARMIYPDETYPVADSVSLEAVDDLGASVMVPLDNPEIEVRAPSTRPTVPPTATDLPPTATPTPTPTATAEASATPESRLIYLPLTRHDAN